MTRQKPPFIQIIEKSMQELTAELEKGKSITDFASSAGLFAEFYFYLGDVERGKEASYLFSQHCEELVAGNLSRENIISFLFRAGLYRSLAQAPTEAEALWIRFIETRRQWFPDRIIALGKNKRLVVCQTSFFTNHLIPICVGKGYLTKRNMVPDLVNAQTFPSEDTSMSTISNTPSSFTSCQVFPFQFTN